MAHIRRLPSGNFNAVVRLPNGKRKSITRPLKREVEAVAKQLEASLANGGAFAVPDRKLTVAAWATRWLASRNVEPATAAKDRSQIATHVLPQWGTWPLASIGRLDVQAWVKQMTHAGAGASTVTGAYHRFAAMMSDAVLEGVLAMSPCRSIDLPKVVKPAPRWLTRHEYDRVQLALSDQPEWRAFVGLGCFSGLRPGELAGLDVEHLDFDRSLVRVQQVMTRYGLRAYPKSSASVRSVPFPDEVRRLLWALVADRSGGPVFVAPEGGRVDDRNWARRVWAKATESAGLEPVRPYVMRHTCASWLIQAGVPDYEVARMLGHSSTRILGTYAHLAPDRHDRVRAAWAADARMTHAEKQESPDPVGSGL